MVYYRTMNVKKVINNLEQIILEAIQDKRNNRKDIAPIYAYIISFSNVMNINTKKINQAILGRWSPYGLDFIKKHAWISIKNSTVKKDWAAALIRMANENN